MSDDEHDDGGLSDMEYVLNKSVVLECTSPSMFV